MAGLTGEPNHDVSALLKEASDPYASPDERYRLVRRAMSINTPMGIDPSEVSASKKQALKIYEKLAIRGHVDSMCECVTYYHNGWHDERNTMRRSSGATGFETTSQPDNAKAKKWCEKAAAAGSEWARDTALPVITEELAKEKASGKARSR